MPFLFTLLAFVLTSLLGAAAAFAQTNPFGGGAGTEGMPYQISTIAHLNAIRDNSDSSGEDYLARGLYFALMNDLDFEDTDGNGADYVYSDVSDTENDKGWLPIGHDTEERTSFQGTAFSATFDGDGHVIRNFLISRADEDYVGLFGVLQFGAFVKNLGVEGVNVGGKAFVGGLVGESNQGKITSCYSTGSVTGMGERVGGLVGRASPTDATITSCYSTADVTGSDVVGGLVGGIATAAITSCYSTGSVTGTGSGTFIGGFLGLNGLFGGARFAGPVSGSYWENADAVDTDVDTTDRTPTQMRALTLADLGDTGGLSWAVGTGNQYPALRTYKVNDSDDQVQGDVIAGQPCPRAECGPLVSIAAGTSPVTEGTAAEFTLTRVGDTTAALTVMVIVTGGDSFLSGAATTEAIFGAGEATVTFSLTTENDEVDEADGTITATIPASASTYRLGTATATVAIADNDPILVSITGATSAEGAGTVFTLMRARAEAGALAVKVTVAAGTGDFLTDPLVVTEGASTTVLALVSGSVTVTIAADQDSQTFTVSTDDDTTDEAAGTLTATITAEVDGPYRVHATDAAILMASVEVGVTDNDLPLVSIAAGTSPVTEGTAAEFILTRVGITTEALTASVSVTDPGDFLSGAATTQAVFGAGDATVILSLTTDDDDMDEAEGMVTVTVTEAVTSYRVDGTVTASVAVTDDDLPSITSFEIGGSSGSIAEDADPKTISVAVTEGTSLADLDPTVVTVRSDATVAPAGMVTFVDGTAQDFTVTAGGDTVTYKVTVNVVVGTPPGVPGGFSAVAGVEQVTLSWTAPTDLGSTLMLSKYEYQQTQGVDVSPWKAVEPATALTQVVGGLVADVVYGFEVRAVGSNGLAGEPTAKQEATPLAVGGLMFMGTIANQTYTKNTAITSLELPVATGGMGPYMYTLVPVPAGLMFDATTRTLSGMPTAVTPTPTTHTYTVTDTTADTALTESMTFTITVNEEGSPTFADTIANQTYTENTVITDLVLPVATGGMGSLTYALTPVPDGLEFDATNRTLSGTPTIPTPTPTTHTYTVTDSTPDTALTASLTFTITVSEAEEPTLGIGSLGAAVHVYPNPAGDVLYIEFPGAGEYGIALLTVTGQQVFGGQHAGGGTKKLDVSTLKGGVYFLKIEDGEGGSHTVRIIL